MIIFLQKSDDKVFTPSWGSPSPPNNKAHDISPNYDRSLQNFQPLVAYLADVHWTKNNLIYVAPYGGNLIISQKFTLVMFIEKIS